MSNATDGILVRLGQPHSMAEFLVYPYSEEQDEQGTRQLFTVPAEPAW